MSTYVYKDIVKDFAYKKYIIHHAHWNLSAVFLYSLTTEPSFGVQQNSILLRNNQHAPDSVFSNLQKLTNRLFVIIQQHYV